MKILLCEDNDVNALVANKTLKAQQHSVDIATDGVAALHKIIQQNFEYDLILMDLSLPFSSGYEVTKVIRLLEKRDQRERIPIYALTASKYEQVIEACKSCGMDGCMEKPLTSHSFKEFLSIFQQHF
jgi:CheY-like chemotaxis protein